MPGYLDHIKSELFARQQQGTLRQLRLPDPALIDFSSNDYLGLRTYPGIAIAAQAWAAQFPATNGSGGSRLLNGHSHAAAQLERELATFFSSEGSLFFPSGFMANLAVCSALPGRHDVVFYDSLCHASLKDGLRLGLATRHSFPHNDIAALAEQLERSRGTSTRFRFIVTETIFSMDGDLAPLEALVTLAEQHDAILVLDEAHSTGLYGSRGEGLACDIAARYPQTICIMTFGKGPGIDGAAVCGPQPVLDYLVNTARPFIYSTAPGLHQLAQVAGALAVLPQVDDRRRQLQDNILFFRREIEKQGLVDALLPSPTAIQIVVPGLLTSQESFQTDSHRRVKAMAQRIQEAGYDVRPILSPTVAVGSERLRICLHAQHTEAQLTGLVQAVAEALNRPA